MDFKDFNLNKGLWSALDDLGISQATSIQEKSFSVIMSGRDVVGIAQTGTGKTYAYLLPLLRMWKFSKERFPQILIVVPTRELVVQVVEEIEKLTTYMNFTVVGAFGGVNLKRHAFDVAQGCDAVVATPGRLLDLCLHGALKLKSIKKFVVDEVDEMLNLGFLPQLQRVIDFLPEKRQNLLFSATMIPEVEAIINKYFNLPEKIEAAPMGTPLENIDQSAIPVLNFNTKVNLLVDILKDKQVYHKVLVFLDTKRMADLVHEELLPYYEEEMTIIHSNKSQNFRFNAVNAFTKGEARILVATDLVARGIDVSGVSHVINFNIPEVPENYIHRIGRTGRADRRGSAISFFTKEEEEPLAAIQELMSYEIPRLDFPDTVAINEELIDEEQPNYAMRNTLSTHKIDAESGGAFHEKKDKNKKVNNPIRKAERMRIKYKKPKTRGQKKRGKR